MAYGKEEYGALGLLVGILVTALVNVVRVVVGAYKPNGKNGAMYDAIKKDLTKISDVQHVILERLTRLEALREADEKQQPKRS